jgi:hypothetical protein
LLILFSKELLSLIYGQEFVVGSQAFAIPLYLIVLIGFSADERFTSTFGSKAISLEKKLLIYGVFYVAFWFDL